VLNYKTLEDIFSGRIINWNDKEIQAINSPQVAADLPNQKILPIYRSDASGENYLFSDYLLHLDPTGFEAYQQACSSGGSTVGRVADPSEPGDPTSRISGVGRWRSAGRNGSDAAANYVSASSSDGAITYVETAYAKEHDMPVASVVNASNNAVQPTSEDDAVALEKAVLNTDLTQNLAGVYTNPLPAAYPISAYSYFVTPCSRAWPPVRTPRVPGNNSTPSTFASQKGQALGQFIQFVGCAGQSQMAQLGYSPLPPNLVQDDFDAIGRLKWRTGAAPGERRHVQEPFMSTVRSPFPVSHRSSVRPPRRSWPAAVRRPEGNGTLDLKDRRVRKSQRHLRWPGGWGGQQCRRVGGGWTSPAQAEVAREKQIQAIRAGFRQGERSHGGVGQSASLASGGWCHPFVVWRSGPDPHRTTTCHSDLATTTAVGRMTVGERKATAMERKVAVTPRDGSEGSSVWGLVTVGGPVRVMGASGCNGGSGRWRGLAWRRSSSSPWLIVEVPGNDSGRRGGLPAMPRRRKSMRTRHSSRLHHPTLPCCPGRSDHRRRRRRLRLRPAV